MDLHRPLRTDRRLWLVCNVLVFVLLGFVHFYPEGVKTGPSSMWSWIGRAIQTAAEPDGWAFLPVFVPILAMYAIVLVVPAVMFGWVAQAVIVVVRDGRRQRAERIAHRPN